MIKGIPNAASCPHSESQIDGMSTELARQGIRFQGLLLASEEPSSSESERSGLESRGGTASGNGSSHARLPADHNVSLLRQFLGDTEGAQGSEAARSQGMSQLPQSRASQSEVTSSSKSQALDAEGRHTGSAPAKAKGGYKEAGLDARKAAPHEPNKLIAETFLGEIRQLSSCQPLLYCGRHRVLANTAFRGYLEITPDLKIKVCPWGCSARKVVMSGHREVTLQHCTLALSHSPMQQVMRSADGPGGEGTTIQLAYTRISLQGKLKVELVFLPTLASRCGRTRRRCGSGCPP